ncbi:MAG: hypothetical protein WD557_11655 [Dehalococcoidia bacterium]
MPSPRRSAFLTGERRTQVIFGVCALAIAATWLFGISLRTPLWTDDIVKLTNPGMSRSFPDLSGMFGTFFIIMLATAAYLGCLWALLKGFRRSWEAAVVATVLAALAWLPSTTLSSPDAVHLAADVRTFWLHGTFPASWEGRPSEIDDPIADQVVQYHNRPSGYGPVAYAIGGAPLPFVGDNLKLNLLGQKVVSGTFLVLAAAIAGLLARWLGHNAGLATGIVGLNPMMLWQFPGDAHNDTIMVTLGLLAVPLLLATAWRKRIGGIGLAVASVLSKFGLVLAGPVIVAYWFPRWRTLLAVSVAALGAAGLALLVAAGASFGLGTIGPASAIAPITPWDILWDATDRDPEARRWISVLDYSLFALVLSAIVWKHPLETAQDVVTAAATSIFFFLFLCCPGFLPWYQIWYLPLAAVSGKRWLVVTAVVFSIGAWLPLMAYNWRGPIERDMGVSEPMQKAAGVLWLATGITAAWLFRNDTRETQAQQVDVRRARRAAPRKAIRARR